MSVYGRGARGGHAVVEIMAGIGRACPRLRDKRMTSVARCPVSDPKYNTVLYGSPNHQCW